MKGVSPTEPNNANAASPQSSAASPQSNAASPQANKGDVTKDKEEYQEQEEHGEKPITKPMAAPSEPSAKEIEEHEIAHLPPRSWCWFCVQGRGRKGMHFRIKDDDETHKIPTVSVD